MYVSFPLMLKTKAKLIEERKYFFKKYFCREEKELMKMFDEADKLKWIANRDQLHEASILIENYRRRCKERGMDCI